MQLSFLRPALRRALFVSGACFISVASVADTTSSFSPETVVARRGTATLTLSDMDAMASKIPEAERANVLDNAVRLDTAINGVLLTKQLAQEARKKGVGEDSLSKAKIQLAVDERLAAIYLDSIQSTAVPELSDLAEETYRANRSAYIEHGPRDARHILISLEKHSEAEAKQLVTQVREEATKPGASFEDLVAKYSEDGSKDVNHGEMKVANSQKYEKNFAAAVQSLGKIGEISPPVRTKFGFHIIKLESAAPDHQLSLAEAKPRIIEALKRDYLDKAKRDIADRLRGEQLEANPEVVGALRTRYTSPISNPTPQSAQIPAVTNGQ